MENKNIISHRFELCISIDSEQIKQKYPNYCFNFNDIDSFVNFISSEMKHLGDIDLSKEGMGMYGYSVSIKPLK